MMKEDFCHDCRHFLRTRKYSGECRQKEFQSIDVNTGEPKSTWRMVYDDDDACARFEAAIFDGQEGQQ